MDSKMIYEVLTKPGLATKQDVTEVCYFLKDLKEKLDIYTKYMDNPIGYTLEVYLEKLNFYLKR